MSYEYYILYKIYSLVIYIHSILSKCIVNIRNIYFIVQMLFKYFRRKMRLKQCGIYIHIQWNVIQQQKRRIILPFAITWMSLEAIIRNEISQSDKYFIVTFICGI